jgi:hypothetical protein
MERASGKYGGQERCMQGSVGIPEEGDHLEDLGLQGRIKLKWIFNKWGVDTTTGLICLGHVVGACECGNEPSGSIKWGEFRDYPETC